MADGNATSKIGKRANLKRERQVCALLKAWGSMTAGDLGKHLGSEPRGQLLSLMKKGCVTRDLLERPSDRGRQGVWVYSLIADLPPPKPAWVKPKKTPEEKAATKDERQRLVALKAARAKQMPGLECAAAIVQAEIARAESMSALEEGGKPVFNRDQMSAGICALYCVADAIQRELALTKDEVRKKLRNQS